MKKKISAKVGLLIALMGVFSIIIIFLNVDALVSTEEWIEQVTEHITEMEDSVHNGDLEAASEAGEEVDYVLKRLTARVSGTRVFNVILIFVVFILNVIFTIIAYNTISKPAKIADKSLENIINTINNNEGDLTLRVEQKSVDEIGRLVSGINTFIEQLQGILTETKEISAVVNELSEDISEHVSESSDNASSISATMEELSASFEEITATLAGISESIHAVSVDAETMDSEVKVGQNFVNNMTSVANETNAYINQSQQEVVNRVKEIKEMLEVAIENSRSVEKINALTDEILDISEQTSLLSLNASIEAARAGQAGKGFSVVAGEISNLSESSKATASNIQTVNMLVSKTVGELVESSRGLLEFIDNVVLADYDRFVKITGKYQNDATEIHSIFDTFNELSSDLGVTMKGITESIDGINIAVEESAKGVVMTAEATADLVSAFSVIQSNTDRSNQVADDLDNQVSRFKNL